MNIKYTGTILALAIVGVCLAHAAPNVGEYKIRVAEEESSLDTADDDSDVFNLLIPYRPLRATEIEGRDIVSEDGTRISNMVPSESEVVFDIQGGPLPKSSLVPIQSNKPLDNPAVEQIGAKPSDNNMEKVKSIAFNNREVKLVGPDRREVEVKSDVASQMAVALENLQKETTQVWGQVNEKLDKGWTEFKAMVENAMAKNSASRNLVNPSTSSSGRQLREAPSKDFSSLVMVRDVDGYSMASDDDSLSKQAETAGTKIKGFLSNIGFNEENGKKANEALSKAGASVSETMTKDLPDTLKKAGSAVSDTVTKDIPDAFKNFFG